VFEPTVTRKMKQTNIKQPPPAQKEVYKKPCSLGRGGGERPTEGAKLGGGREFGG